MSATPKLDEILSWMKRRSSTSAELAKQAAAELAALTQRLEAAEAELRFLNGFIMGDGDHDKVLLVKDADVFLKCFKLLGLDVSGTDIQEIPDAIERLKGDA